MLNIFFLNPMKWNKWVAPGRGLLTVADPGFSWGCANPQSGCPNLILQFFAENYVEMKEFRLPLIRKCLRYRTGNFHLSRQLYSNIRSVSLDIVKVRCQSELEPWRGCLTTGYQWLLPQYVYKQYLHRKPITEEIEVRPVVDVRAQGFEVQQQIAFVITSLAS